MKLDQERRLLLKASGLSILLLPVTFLFKSTGCAQEQFDVVITRRAGHAGSILDITRSEFYGVQSDWNRFISNDRETNAQFVYSVNGMWGEWIFEVNGDRINVNVADYHVQAGDLVTWKGKFSR